MRKQALCIISVQAFLLSASLGTVSGQSSAKEASGDSQDTYPSLPGLPEWMGRAAYADFGYRTTQFYQPDYDAMVFLGESRLKFWLPPGRDTFIVKR